MQNILKNKVNDQRFERVKYILRCFIDIVYIVFALPSRHPEGTFNEVYPCSV